MSNIGNSKKRFRIFPERANQLTRIGLGLLFVALIIRFLTELYVFFILDYIKYWRWVSFEDYWIVYLVFALTSGIVLLGFLGKSNLGLVLIGITSIALFFESQVAEGNRTTDLFKYLNIVFDYDNFPNMTSEAFMLFTANQVTGILTIVSFALLILGREDVRGLLKRNS